jgi:hypothetical protein
VAAENIGSIVNPPYIPDDDDSHIMPRSVSAGSSLWSSTSVASQLLKSQLTLGNLQCSVASRVTKMPPLQFKGKSGAPDWVAATKKDDEWKAALFHSFCKRITLAPVEASSQHRDARQPNLKLEAQDENPWNCIPLVLPSLGERCTLV